MFLDRGDSLTPLLSLSSKIEHSVLYLLVFNMKLPDEILAYIEDFNRPVTRPDWCNLHRMTAYKFHRAILYKYNRQRVYRRNYRQVIYTFVSNYCRNPQDKYIYDCAPYMDGERFVSVMQLRLKN